MNIPHRAAPIIPSEIARLAGSCPIIIEIGSHEGSDTVRFLEAMPNARIFCFEPDPRPIARFRKTLGEDSRVTLIEEAVSDTDGPKDFWASTGMAGGRTDWDYSGSLRKPTGHLVRSPEIGFKAPEPVYCVRLDTWLENHELVADDINVIDFAWVDIQGDQLAFLDGAQRTLKIIRHLYIEAHDWRQPLYEGETTQEELIELLPGFEPVAIYDHDNILFRNRSFA